MLTRVSVQARARTKTGWITRITRISRSPGQTLCGAALALALGLLVLHGARLLAVLSPATLPWAVLGAALGAVAADAVTGLVHWACDTWGDERTPWIGRPLIGAFRMHHDEPHELVDHHWTTVNRDSGIAAGAVLALLALPGFSPLLLGHPALYAFLCSFVAYGGMANQLHLWAHAERPPRPVRWAQRLRLVLTPEHHARHHRAPYTSTYCIATGWLDPVLERLGLWRALERGVTRVTGSAPRESSNPHSTAPRARVTPHTPAPRPRDAQPGRLPTR